MNEWINKWMSEYYTYWFPCLDFRNYIANWKQRRQPLFQWNKLNISAKQKQVPWLSTVQGIHCSTWTICFRHLLLWRKIKKANIVSLKIFRNTLLQLNPRWKPCWQKKKVWKCKCKSLRLAFILLKHKFPYLGQA